MSDKRIFLGTGIHPTEIDKRVPRMAAGRQINNPEIVRLSRDSLTEDSRIAGVQIKAGRSKRTKHDSPSWAKVYGSHGNVLASTHDANPLTIPAGAALLRLIGDCQFDYFPKPKPEAPPAPSPEPQGGDSK